MGKVRIGFIGAGSMGQCAHLRNYVIAPGCEVVALAELRPQLATKVAQRYGIEHVYRDHRAMLEAEQFDAIVAIQPYPIHGRLLPELMDARVPILIEKPLARSVEIAESIVSKVHQTGGRLFVGYHKRSDPATAWALRQIEAWKSTGEFGAMRYIRVTMPPGDWIAGGFSTRLTTDEPYPPLEFDPPPDGMDDATARRYDAFVNYYIHQINLIRLLLGEEYRITYADPSGVLLAGLSRGAVAVSLEMQPYRTTIDWQETALIAFEKGWIRLDLPAPLAIDRAGRVTVFEDKGDRCPPRTISPALEPVHAMRRQAEHFIAEVRGEGPTVLCRAEEALEDLKLARRYIEMAKG